ncbi:hypothetical protein [Clostridium sp. DL-VIII]|uniref:hypothetical protein n=1 Tax=Clostridium sp. DL-VIII TaxID=641107 RepID=UPI001FA711C2|nr:hypothetical protein [Clostridium sp. DL-VIII]
MKKFKRFVLNKVEVKDSSRSLWVITPCVKLIFELIGRTLRVPEFISSFTAISGIKANPFPQFTICLIISRLDSSNGPPILIKINSEDFMEDGLTSEESIEASKIFEKAGIDAIEVSGGNGSSPKVLKGNLAVVRTEIAASKDKESYFAKHASLLAKEVNIPVIFHLY